ncbi:MAG TPA: class I SAM-dependent methyltransferase [Pirellulales bacterium]|nr:class I SAM-dependent methyltransferase [Pirellulales bacterium]
MFKGSNEIPQGFDSPTALPKNAEEARAWQDANRTWWEKNPMRYDFFQKLDGKEEFSREMYEEIDRRFLGLSDDYLHNRRLPFDELIPYDELPQLDVLEIGVGNGTHASLLARHAKSFRGIDLTEYASRSTSRRFQLFDLPGQIMQMDAEKMAFPDASFDFIWSWGVIHHSSDTPAIVREMHRVLRPGGRAIVMVYNRSFWEYNVRRGFFFALYNRACRREHSAHRTTQMTIDGGLARFYTKQEWRNLVGGQFDVSRFDVYGQRPTVLPVPTRYRDSLSRFVPKAAANFVLTTLSQGQYLVAHMKRRDTPVSAPRS